MHSLISRARGALALLLLVLNTLLWCMPLFALALLKLAVGTPALRRRVDPLLNAAAAAWVRCNSAWMRLLLPTRWSVTGTRSLSPRGWYLVQANHQSWVDIFVMQRALTGRLPLLKFFLKRELIYVPVIGLAWWALDFPFLRRHDRAAADRATARRACERYALTPTSVTNFVEGTRCTAAKQQAQRSPYRNLLRPKTGATAVALEVLGDRLQSLVDVTLFYPGGVPTFWQFLCGKVPEVVVAVREVAIPRELRTPSPERAPLKNWLHALWLDKDAQLQSLRAAAAA